MATFTPPAGIPSQPKVVTPAIPATPPKGEVKSMATGILNLLLL
jgi:hypothetical protein